MKTKRFFLLVLTLLILLPCKLSASGIDYGDALQTIADYGTSAQAAVLMIRNDQKLIYSYNEHERLPMASTTKIMTAVIAIENCDLDKEVRICAEACGVEGSSIYLYETEKITARDLLYAVMLESANDAATALAIHVGGDLESFVDLMNQKADSIGMKDTHYTNPHGLDDDEHFSSAYDLAILMDYAMDNELFREVTGTYKYTSPMSDNDEVRVFINHNRLLNTYKGVCGGKTGYTKRSGRCLVSTASRDGVELIAVTLNDPRDWQDHSSLYDAGFSAYEKIFLSQEGEYHFELPVINGNKPTVKASAESLYAVIEKGKNDAISSRVELDRFYYAGIEKGEVLGTLVFSIGEEEIGMCNIIAEETIANIQYKNIFQRILSFFIR